MVTLNGQNRSLSYPASVSSITILINDPVILTPIICWNHKSDLYNNDNIADNDTDNHDDKNTDIDKCNNNV